LNLQRQFAPRTVFREIDPPASMRPVTAFRHAWTTEHHHCGMQKICHGGSRHSGSRGLMSCP
jgi:hypothetical protein